MNIILNIIWVVFGGLMIAIEYAISSVLMMVQPSAIAYFVDFGNKEEGVDPEDFCIYTCVVNAVDGRWRYLHCCMTELWGRMGGA